MNNFATIVNCNPSWSSQYDEEEKYLLNSMSKFIKNIDHVGSTSVPHNGGSGVVDILIGIDSADIDACISSLESLGYKSEKGKKKDFFCDYFVKQNKDKVLFHLFVAKKGSANWKRMIDFRNYLKKHDHIVKEYDELKRKLAKSCISFDEYLDAKSAFIKIVEKRICPNQAFSFEIKKASSLKDFDEITKFLLPYEKCSLFLIGNLTNKDFPSYYYIAHQEGKIIGVSAYFPVFNSFSLFSEYTDVSKKLVSTAANNHHIKTLLGMGVCSREASDEFLKLGYKVEIDPKLLFMELNFDNFKFFEPHEGVIVPVTEKEIDQIVILNRHLYRSDLSLPIKEDERNIIRFNPIKYCLKIDGKVISSAVSNGIANDTFQLLSVVTSPEYRGRGFAKSVCSHIIRYFIENHDPRRAVIITSYDNVPAQKIYHDLGFKITDEYLVVNFNKRRNE